MTITSYPPIAGSTTSTTNAPWYLQVARGQVPGVSQVNVFGYSANVDGTFTALWNNAAYVFPTTASVLTLASTSASDNTAASILISGLDANWDAISEIKTLNGTTNVTTTKAFLRINSFTMVSPGTGQLNNVGTITAKVGATTYALMNPTIGKMTNSWYSVPRANTFYLDSIYSFTDSVTGNNFANFRAVLVNNASATPVTYQLLQTAFQGQYAVLRTDPLAYTEKTDIQWQFTVDSGTHKISCIVQGILIDNTAP